MMKVQQLRQDEAFPKGAKGADSRASSCHPILDQFPTTSTTAATSTFIETSTSSSPNASSPSASTPRVEIVESQIVGYDTIKRRREGTALVIEHPTLVNFVPTSDIQTAVRVLPDCVIIDTILPPTATLRAANIAHTSRGVHLESSTAAEARDFDAKDLLEKHKKDVYRTLQTRLTESYDPTGSIKREIFTTLTGLTRFPNPRGTNRSPYATGLCPCICCEMGCDRPLEPNTATTSTSVASSSPTSSKLAISLHARSASVPNGEKSFLDMTEASLSSNSWRGTKDRSKPRFGFLTFGRFRKSRSNGELAFQADPKGKGASIPLPAPAVSEQVTNWVVPPKPSRSRSFSDLVRRRRNKHHIATSIEFAPPLPPSSSTRARNESRVRQSMDDQNLRLPARSSSNTNLAGVSRGSYSLDSARTRTRADTPREGPQPPPRRSSKAYAVVRRKSVPQLNASTSGNSMTLLRSGKSAYGGIGQIVEEDEDKEVGSSGNGSTSRRQSALMSSFELVSNEELYANYPRTSVDVGQGWAFRSVRTHQYGSQGDVTMPVGKDSQTQFGLAI
ncbi:uncharacterized protein MEPE_02256 [Melanopsichium pennsylvanicum]|uniref:Uncharacterized protein n=2 Tax=Melanopsichium pennsylvanicum TaxID=63383 RepID=A0AAJ5C4I8_9BASI|nr:hypothetical protein BN887_03259 [Melanopsichium pennsylvanicum 4]SNX83549.1 uncharacterized protein MEPE_02256 [Melanopsichium pennsylvanicum]